MKKRNREKLEDIIGAVCIFATCIVILFLAHGLEGLW